MILNWMEGMIVMNVNSSHLEEFLEWQVNACDADKATELRQALRENRDRHKRRAKYFESEVMEERMLRSEADRCRRIGAWLAARRALQMILRETTHPCSA
jgi:hypothetical protein